MVKRYEPEAFESSLGAYIEMNEDNDGGYVKYEDYKALQKERNALNSPVNASLAAHDADVVSDWVKYTKQGWADHTIDHFIEIRKRSLEVNND